jgi:hypothetical protein
MAIFLWEALLGIKVKMRMLSTHLLLKLAAI